MMTMEIPQCTIIIIIILFSPRTKLKSTQLHITPATFVWALGCWSWRCFVVVVCTWMRQYTTEHINLNGNTLICHVQHDHINSNPIPCLMYPSTTAPLYPHHSFHQPDWLTCWWFSPRHSVHRRVPSVRDAGASEYAGQRDYFPTAGDPSTPEQVPGRRKAMTSLQFATLRDDYCTTSVTYRGRRPGHSQG